MDPLSSWVEQVIRESQRLIANLAVPEPPAQTRPVETLPEALRRRLNWRPVLERD